jgi:hypothetical protein
MASHVEDDPVRKWNTWLNGTKVEVMIWDGRSEEALRLFAGDQFCYVFGNHIAKLGRSASHPNQFAHPGDFILRNANDDSPVLIIPSYLTWFIDSLRVEP